MIREYEEQKEREDKEKKESDEKDVLVCASPPENPSEMERKPSPPKFMSINEALSALTSGSSNTVIVKAVVTDVASSLRCSDGELSMDVKIEDGSSGMVVTLSSSVLESLLGKTPGQYSAAEQEMCVKLQREMEKLEGLFTLSGRLGGGGTFYATSIQPVSIAYHLYLQQRVSNSTPSSAIAELTSKLN